MDCATRVKTIASFSALHALAFSMMLLSACSTTSLQFRLHSPERDKQGQSLKEAWSKVDLKSQLEVPRENLKKTLAEQLATEEEIWSKRRSVIAGQMAHDWTVETFQNKAASGLQRVIGSISPPVAGASAAAAPSAAASAAASYLTQATMAKAVSDNRDRAAARILMLGVSAPTCEIVNGDPSKLKKYADEKLSGFPADKPEKAGLFVGFIVAMQGSCKGLQDASKAQRQIIQPDKMLAPTGELGKAFVDLDQEESALEKDKTAAELAATSLKAVQAELDAAEKALKASPGADTKKAVEDALDKLKKWQADVKKLEASPLLGKLLSEVRLESLDTFLATYDAAATGKGTAPGSNRLAVALALIPEMQRKSDEALANAERPNLTPFILRKNIEQARANAASRDVERRAAIIDLQRRIVATLEDQLEAYAGAYAASLQVNKKTRVKEKDGKEVDVDVRWAEALQAVESKPNVSVSEDVLKPKIAAWRASTRYLEAEGRLRADVGQTYYSIYALQYEGVLLYSESSIAQWKGLVDPSVDLLAQWGAAGVVPRDVIQLFNSLMLLGIAVGVN